MKKYELAIFDLDGTILDTLADLTGSTNAALASCGFPSRTIDEVREFVGNGIRKLIERAVPVGTEKEDEDKVYTAFKAHYMIHNADETRPYPGVEELLNRLREAGLKLAVVSNKADEAVQALCEKYYPGVFDIAVGEKPGVRKKPAPDTVDMVLETLGTPRDGAAYIGDSDVDIQTALNAGIDEFAVTWGFRGREFLIENGAKTLLDSPAQLYETLTGDRNGYRIR